MMDIVEILEETLEVIKRQRAEVKRLSAEVKRLAADKESLKERLCKERIQFADLCKMHSAIRAEAVQEFETRLREKIELDSDLNLDSYDIIVLENHMESIANEMTEVSE